MSDGMSDANAIGRLVRELMDAAYNLRDAIIVAEEGHRGMTVDVIATVNEILGGTTECGYRLREAIPDRIMR